MEAKNDFIFLLFMLAALWVAWVVAGGPNKTSSPAPLMRAPEANLDSRKQAVSISNRNDTEPTENSSSQVETATEEKLADIEKISFVRSATGAKRTKAQEEYVSIKADRANTKAVRITGLTLRSVISGRSYTIPQGVPLYYGGRINNDQDVYLSPNETAVILTGRSPIGASFKLNSCTGYLEQFQNFSPRLSRSCPDPENELDLKDVDIIRSYGDACITFIERMPRCELNLKSIPLGFPEQCVRFITEEITYNGCIKSHKDDADFYDNEWRIFLGRENEVWRAKREAIEIVSPQGKVLDTLSY
jgi:hypothetical protein